MPERRQSRFDNSMRSRWGWEILSLFGSMVFLAAMVGLVFSFDGRALDAWTIPVTLNAFVAVLSIVAKACLLFAIYEAIGQWKWILFAGERQIGRAHV